MKKTTMTAIRNYLTSNPIPELADALAEIDAELKKGEEKAEANRAAYADMWEAVRAALETAGQPVTRQEIANETKLPAGKIGWALTNMWADLVERDSSGKVNTYTLKA
jgi:hypothetical protein